MRRLIVLALAFMLVFALSISAQDSLIVAPEFPQGTNWVNSATPPSIDQFLGKVLLIAFFDLADADGIIVQEDIAMLQNKYSSELCVVGMQVSRDSLIGDRNSLRHTVLREEIGYPVMIDREQSVSNAYSITTRPTLVVVDPVGEITGKYSGINSVGAMDSTIATTIAGFDSDGRLSRRVVSFQTELSQQENSLLFYPSDVTIDPRDSTLFICDANHHRVIATTLEGAVKYVIGSGQRGNADNSFAEASFNKPQSIVFSGHSIYIADTYNHTIREADLRSHSVTTIIGNGARAEVTFLNRLEKTYSLSLPKSLLKRQGRLYFEDIGLHQIGFAEPKDWEVDASYESGLPVDSVVFNGKLYEPDRDNHRIRVIDMKSQDTSYLQLSKLEALAKQEMKNFHGRPIDFQPQNIKVGNSRISIALVLPDGYRLYQASPFFVNYASSDEKVIAFASAPDQLRLNQADEFEIPLVADFGAADLTVDVVVYFHKDGDDTVLFDVIRANLDVAAINTGPAMFGVALNARALPR